MINAKDREFFEDFLAKFRVLNMLLTMMIKTKAEMKDMDEFDFEFNLFKRSSDLIASFETLINKFIDKTSEYSNASIGMFFACAAISPSLEALVKVLQETTRLAFQGRGGNDRLLFEMVRKLIVLNQLISETEKLDVMKELVKTYNFTFKLKGLDPKGPEYKAIDQFIKAAKVFNPCLVGHDELTGKIKIILDYIFPDGGKFQEPEWPHNFIALVGPYYKGKTQNAFNLALEYPVFYINFSSGKKDSQSVYRAFSQISERFRQDLKTDLKTLFTKAFKSDPNSLMDFKRIEYNTVGLIWSLFEVSQKFNFNDPNQSWMKFYLAEREIQYDAMSVETFWNNLSKRNIIRDNILYIQLYVYNFRIF